MTDVASERTPKSERGSASNGDRADVDRTERAGGASAADPERALPSERPSEELDDRAESALGGGDAAVGLDPLEISLTLARLLGPRKVVPELPKLAGELAKVALGTSDLEYAKKDRRFADPAWTDNPLYHRLGQAYLALEQTGDRLVEHHTDWLEENRARYVANIVLGGLAPTNYLLGNPAALKRAFETGGRSLLRGARNAGRDVLTNGGMPRTVDRGPYKVGENLAVTPGAVVYREEMFEVLQYAPQTKRVKAVPLLFVPPELNRYYVLDLAPDRSMVEFAVKHGVEVYMVAWRNPRKDNDEHSHWGLEDYLEGTIRAFDVVREISGSDRLNCVGLCAGGVTASLALGHLAARGESPVAALTLLVTMLEGKQENMVSTMATTRMERLLEKSAAKGKVFGRKALERNFALMRPNDLIFQYIGSGWLSGEDPPAFDVLAWNADPTNATAAFERDSINVIAKNLAATPDGCTLLGTPIDLSAVECDNFVVAGHRDHITTWRPCYMTSQILGGQSEVVVAATGHVQTFVNPPGQSRYKYWKGPETGPDPDAWLAASTQQEGSWWPEWMDWLLPRSGDEKRAPSKLGSKKHPILGDAPGTYVHEV